MPQLFQEKRDYQRVPLDIPLFVTLKTADNRELPVQLLNCSRGGVQLVFAPKDENYSLEMLNSFVSLLHLPRPMDPTAAGRVGRVAWVASGRCGVRFDEPLLITEGEIKEVAEEL